MTLLSTGRIARICEVSQRTVSKWIDEGWLQGFRIPNSKHRRVPLEVFRRFVLEHRMLSQEEFQRRFAVIRSKSL